MISNITPGRSMTILVLVLSTLATGLGNHSGAAQAGSKEEVSTSTARWISAWQSTEANPGDDAISAPMPFAAMNAQAEIVGRPPFSEAAGWRFGAPGTPADRRRTHCTKPPKYGACPVPSEWPPPPDSAPNRPYRMTRDTPDNHRWILAQEGVSQAFRNPGQSPVQNRGGRRASEESPADRVWRRISWPN